MFHAGAGPIADEAVPSLMFGGCIEVDIEVPEGGGEGVPARGELDRRLGARRA